MDDLGECVVVEGCTRVARWHPSYSERGDLCAQHAHQAIRSRGKCLRYPNVRSDR